MSGWSGDGGMSPGASRGGGYSNRDGGMLIGGGGGTTVVPLSSIVPTWSATTKLLKPAPFPDRGWDPVLRAQLLLEEFARLDWRTMIQHSPPPSSDGDIRGEIDALILLKKKRDERWNEIVLQDQSMSLYWSSVFHITARNRPASWTLISAAMAIGHMVGRYFKNEYKRPRPVDYAPAVAPMIVTPPHPAYPSGHALQSHLIAAFLKRACVDLSEAAGDLAARISENREYAGLHFHTDTLESIRIAQLVDGLIVPGSCSKFMEVLEKAKCEWAS